MPNSGTKKMLNQNAEFASLLKKTPLQLKCQIDPISIPKVKVYFCHANHDHKAELPVNSMEDAKTILYSISEFQSFIEHYNINGQNTFTYYHEMLTGTAHGSWDTTMQPYIWLMLKLMLTFSSLITFFFIPFSVIQFMMISSLILKQFINQKR